MLWRYLSTSRKWLEADADIDPARVLDRRALVAARSASRATAQLIARRIAARADHQRDESHRRTVLAPVAVDPDPRRGRA
jgi:hypothetical protein